MKITDVLNRETIIPDLRSRDKKGAIEELAKPVADFASLDYREVVQVLMSRERLGTTGIGGGIGIPHGKLNQLQQLLLGVGLSRKGVNFEAIDGKPAHIFFLLVTPENEAGLHLQLLSRISRILKNDSFKESLMRAVNREEIYNVIKEEDEAF